jgi:hypothetical protein
MSFSFPLALFVTVASLRVYKVRKINEFLVVLVGRGALYSEHWARGEADQGEEGFRDGRQSELCAAPRRQSLNRQGEAQKV